MEIIKYTFKAYSSCIYVILYVKDKGNNISTKMISTFYNYNIISQFI